MNTFTIDLTESAMYISMHETHRGNCISMHMHMQCLKRQISMQYHEYENIFTVEEER